MIAMIAMMVLVMVVIVVIICYPIVLHDHQFCVHVAPFDQVYPHD